MNHSNQVLLYNFNFGMCKQPFNLINQFQPQYDRYVLDYCDMSADVKENQMGFDKLFALIHNMPNHLIIPHRSQLLEMTNVDLINNDVLSGYEGNQPQQSDQIEISNTNEDMIDEEDEQDEQS